MKIGDLTKDFTLTKKAKSERADLINEFLERINQDRIGTKFKPAIARSVAILINQHPNLKTISSLYQFLSLCKQAKSFNAYFYWVTKTKKTP